MTARDMENAASALPTIGSTVSFPVAFSPSPAKNNMTAVWMHCSGIAGNGDPAWMPASNPSVKTDAKFINNKERPFVMCQGKRTSKKLHKLTSEFKRSQLFQIPLGTIFVIVVDEAINEIAHLRACQMLE